MKCFQHQTQEAVGICKSCGKGLCAECAYERDRGIVCGRVCLKYIVRLDHYNEQLLDASKANNVRNGVLFLTIGISLGAWGFITGRSMLLMEFLGVVLSVFGVLSLWRAFKSPELPEYPDDESQKKD